MDDIELLITSIKELTKKRRLIYINYEPAFALYSSEIKNFKITENTILSNSDYRAIVETILNKRATVRAMALLKDKDYTVAGLKGKLKEGYYPEESIECALDYISHYGYLDDERYATNYINFKSGSKTRKQIEMELKNKGVESSVIDMVCDRFYSENTDTELNQAKQYIIKKCKNIDNLDYKEIQKIKGYLYRKGFSIDVINKALDIVE